MNITFRYVVNFNESTRRAYSVVPHTPFACFLSLLLHKTLSIVHNVSDRMNSTLKFMKRVSSMVILNCLCSKYFACGEIIHASWYLQGAEAHVVELIIHRTVSVTK